MILSVPYYVVCVVQATAVTHQMDSMVPLFQNGKCSLLYVASTAQMKRAHSIVPLVHPRSLLSTGTSSVWFNQLDTQEASLDMCSNE